MKTKFKIFAVVVMLLASSFVMAEPTGAWPCGSCNEYAVTWSQITGMDPMHFWLICMAECYGFTVIV